MAMTQINVQLHHVISGISAATGRDIVRAIVASKRNAATPAKPRDLRIKANEAEAAVVLQGNWREVPVRPRAGMALIDTYAAQVTDYNGSL